jgi:nicotinic acid phosphoribosyltransferase
MKVFGAVEHDKITCFRSIRGAESTAMGRWRSTTITVASGC